MERISLWIAIGLALLLVVVWMMADPVIVLGMTMVLLPAIYVLLGDKYSRLRTKWLPKLLDKVLPKSQSKRLGIYSAVFFWGYAAWCMVSPMEKPTTGRPAMILNPIWNVFGNDGVVALWFLVGAGILYLSWKYK